MHVSSAVPVRIAEVPERALYAHGHLSPLIKQLIRIRKQRNLSQSHLNDIIGYTDNLVSRWECGDRFPSAFALFAWAEALGCEVVIKTKP